MTLAQKLLKVVENISDEKLCEADVAYSFTSGIHYPSYYGCDSNLSSRWKPLVYQ